MTARGAKQRPWAEADDAALVELRASCTDDQLAAYLDRTVAAVRLRLVKLRREGAGPAKAKTGPKFGVPPGRRLLAKTCPGCGKLRDARHYVFRRDRYDHICRHCANAAKRRALRAPYPSEENVAILQEITFAAASNERKRYTDDEVAVIRDLTRDELTIALDLGRSYYAIVNKRRKLVGARRPGRLGLSPDSHWRIDLPDAIAAAREWFREHGRPVPEALWEWTDEAAAS